MSEPGKPSNRRVFISHARADEAWAAWMTAALRRHGVEVLTPETVTPGTAWADAARAAITGADQVLFVLSGASTSSTSVALELEAAKAAGRPITYITVDPRQPVGAAASDSRVLDASSGSLQQLERQLTEAIGVASPPMTLADEETRQKTGHRSRRDGALSSRYPPPRVASPFVPRLHLSVELERALLDQTPNAPSVALIGPIASGKTTLAANFVAENRWRFRDIAWLRADELQPAIKAIIKRAQKTGPGQTLVVVDDLADPHDLDELQGVESEVTLLVIARTNMDWGTSLTRRLTVIQMSPQLDAEEARALVREAAPNLSAEDMQRIVDATGGLPVLLSALAQATDSWSVGDAVDVLNSFESLIVERAGRYFLDTDDPRLITEWERAFQQLGEEGSAVDLADFDQGSWRRTWRRRFTPERTEQLLDSAERAAEVAALTRPESDANRNNAEAIARLIEASTAIPNLVVISGSVLLIKVTDDRGARIISKTLTATQLRAFEQDERLLSHPAEALNFLAESTPPPPSLTEGAQSAADPTDLS